MPAAVRGGVEPRDLTSLIVAWYDTDGSGQYVDEASVRSRGVLVESPPEARG